MIPGGDIPGAHAPMPLKVLVATTPVDFRNYAEQTIMRSPRREVLPAAAFS